MQRITRRASLSIAIRRCRKSAIAVPLIAMASITATRVQADEGGISFWLPGLFGSLAATPQQPGPTLATIYYHASDTGSGNVATSRAVTIGQYNPTLNVGLSGNLKATADLGLVIPGYVFATPIFGGQAAVSVAGIYGRTTASLNATIYGSLGPFPFSRNFEVDDGRTAFGDVIPQLSLRWNAGTSNFMTYITGDAPVGAYNSNQLANLGIGHGAIDAGGGYTYFNPATGYELSATGGFTYNFENTFTQYQNGVDVHLDVGASRFVTKQLQIGAVGYFYDQLSCDSGTGDKVGCFKSHTAGLGPQIGYIIPMGDEQGYINLKGYKEFAADNRAHGWDLWLTFAISAAPPQPPVKEALVRK